MKNKTVKGIIALAVVTALSFAVIIGSNQLSKNMTAGTQNESAEITEELDVSGAEQIDKAVKTKSGYIVTVREKGYGGDIVMNVSFDEAAASITKLEIAEQNETEGLGSKITEDAFLGQFNGISAPVTLPGMDAGNTSTENNSDNSAILDALDQATLSDGTFTAKGEPDSNGFTEEVTLTVKDGKITEVNWDGITEDGTKKSVMSENGEYVMTEDGLTWKEQAEALADALIENQSLRFLTTNEEGKTDAVSGVSIAVGSFISLTEDCLAQSGNVDLDALNADETSDSADNQNGDSSNGSAGGSAIDAVSGATVSSTAVVNGINLAYEFLQTVK